MENNPLKPSINSSLETPTEKKYLYHMVPDKMEGNSIIPLNKLKDNENPKLRELYDKVFQKYINRGHEYIPDINIPTLENTKWGDVIQLSPIHPNDLKEALKSAGYDIGEMKFYQVDPDLLDSKLTTVFLYNDDLEDDCPENYQEFNKDKIIEHSSIPEETIQSYKNFKTNFPEKKLPILFVKVPHYFVKDSIDVSNLEIITPLQDK